VSFTIVLEIRRNAQLVERHEYMVQETWIPALKQAFEQMLTKLQSSTARRLPFVLREEALRVLISHNIRSPNTALTTDQIADLILRDADRRRRASAYYGLTDPNRLRSRISQALAPVMIALRNEGRVSIVNDRPRRYYLTQG